MSIFHKKDKSQYNELTDNYRPAYLPSAGLSLETFATSDYSLNKPDFIQAQYQALEVPAKPVLDSTDKHSNGMEGYSFAETQHKHVKEFFDAEIANCKNQVSRIRGERETRLEELERKAAPITAKIQRLEAEISPLEGLRAQFQLRIGRLTLSIGALVTLVAMAVDALVNYNFLQSFLFSNATLLWITVACMSVMSDGSMWALGTYLSRRKERFTSKTLFITICALLPSMFLLSVVATIMIRFGSMDATYGTVNAAGEFVAKSSYSLAEYGVSLVTAFITAATGILSFAFSLDENAFLVSVREKKKAELEAARSEYNEILREYGLIKRAEDPAVRDEERRLAAEAQLDVLLTGLKDHYSMLAIQKVNDPDFTEKVCAALSDLHKGKEDVPDESSEVAAVTVDPIAFPHPVVNLK